MMVVNMTLHLKAVAPVLHVPITPLTWSIYNQIRTYIVFVAVMMILSVISVNFFVFFFYLFKKITLLANDKAGCQRGMSGVIFGPGFTGDITTTSSTVNF
jgi:hypothetical protein